MKIDELEVIGLTGGTVDGGWPQGHEPQDDLHALVRISCEGGPVSYTHLTLPTSPKV